jgi:MFS family permease
LAYLVLLGLAALDAAGYSVIAPVVPAIGETTGAGPGTVGALVACFALGQLVGYPIAGRAIAVRPSSWVLGGSLLLITLGDLGFVFGDSLAVFFPARFLQGIGAGGLWMGVVFGVLERYPGEEYRRLAGVLGSYSVGAVAGSAIAIVGGIRGPFALHLVLVVAAGVVVLAIGAPRERPMFGSDRAVLRTHGFRVSAAAVLLVATAVGSLDGPLPLHFAERLSQLSIAVLYTGISFLVAASAAVAGRTTPSRALVWALLTLPLGIALAGATSSVGLWLVAGTLVAIGFGAGEAGALGRLLETTGTDRIVLAMVVWSQLWAAGYLAGPALSGLLAEAFGYGALGLVPVAGAVALALTMRAGAGARVAHR